MENALKALLIAAGIFFALLILSLLVLTYNEIAGYYQNKHDLTVMEQSHEFNSKFANYYRNNIRGTDLISFMNRVIDYNASQAYNEDKNYEPIKVTITLGKEEILKEFKYETDEYTVKDTKTNQYLMKNKNGDVYIITNTSGAGNNWDNDKQLTNITNTSTDMCNDMKSIVGETVTDNQLQLLSSKISTIMADEDGTTGSAIYERLKRQELLEDILGIKINVDGTTGKTKPEHVTTMEKIQNIASQYHQYTQFKRAYFDCTGIKYSTDSKRIIEMNFQLQVKDNKVVFN